MKNRRPIIQRPERFNLNPNNSLFQGLVFAGLGQFPGSTYYHDSSIHKNNGTLTNMLPLSDWVWDQTLNRWCIDFDGNYDHILLNSCAVLIPPFTIAGWVNVADLSTYRCIFSFGLNNDNYYDLRATNSSGNIGMRACTIGGNSTASSAGITVNVWSHVVGIHASTSSRRAATNGIFGTEETTTREVGTPNSAYIGLQKRKTPIYYWSGKLTDICLWNRVLSTDEVKQLADPSNILLSGLILPPRARFFAVPIITYDQSLTDSEGITDAQVKEASYSRIMSESEDLSDTQTKEATYNKTITDSEGIVDALVEATEYTRLITESEAITDESSPSTTYNREITDSEGILDEIVRVRTIIQDLLDNTSLSDSVSPEFTPHELTFLAALYVTLRRNRE